VRRLYYKNVGIVPSNRMQALGLVDHLHVNAEVLAETIVKVSAMYYSGAGNPPNCKTHGSSALQQPEGKLPSSGKWPPVFTRKEWSR